jgi:predicted nucleotidyltransferase
METNLEAALKTVVSDRLKVTEEAIAEFCHRWNITEFSLFGSVLRDDFRLDSDIDVLITFSPNHAWNLFDVMNMQRELEGLFGREVDIVQKKELKNPYRRVEILRSYQVLYASRSKIPWVRQDALIPDSRDGYPTELNS